MKEIKVVQFLFFLGIVTIPFSGIAGVPAFGEMRHELSTYFFLAALCAAVVASLPLVRGAGRATFPNFYVLPRIAALFIGLIALSFVVNMSAIASAFFRDRHGLEKFVSSVATIVYCFALAGLSFLLASERWKKLLAKPIAVSVFLCAAFSMIEIPARWYGVGNGLYDALSAVVHGGFGEPKWDERLRSLAFEPPWFGNYAGFAFPWIFMAWRVSQRMERVVYLGALLCLTVLLLLSEARTGFVMVGGELLVLFLLRFVYLAPIVESANVERLKRAVTSLGFALFFVLAILTAFTHFGRTVASVIESDSTTNISRLSSILAGFSMFFDHPLFGVGFGQYGFHLERYLPYWAYYSSEFTYTPGDEGLWPSSYSVYARFASELGVLGLVFWIGLWGWMCRKSLAASRILRSISGVLPSVSYPLVASACAVLLSGISTETLRSPMIWIVMGVGCRYLAIASSARLDSAKGQGESPSLEQAVERADER
jgi:hypothetical protein